jgi:biotin-dependent carboxylase-like uncharacterized protein
MSEGPALRVVEPGPFTTLQDLGRVGYQRFGVPVAGAMDPVALAIANLLVGNAAGTGALELTLAGGTFEVEAAAARVALAGDFDLRIDGQAAVPWRAYRLGRGQALEVRASRGPARAYLAVAGGFAVAPVLGSVATHTRAGMGGLNGRALHAGDRLPLALDAPGPDPDLALPPGDRPPVADVARVVLGPQADHFTDEAVETFLAAPYRLSALSDRMGARLEGPPLAHAKGANIVSDGVAAGSVQVPGSGLPLVLLADRQTTGGYPKVATVIGADLPLFARLRPGEAVRFAAVTVEAAQAARREQAAWLAGLPSRLVPAGGPAPLDLGALARATLVSGVWDPADG